MLPSKFYVLDNLRGLVCVYKPPDVSLFYLISSFARKLCSELNNADIKPPANYLEIQAKEESVLVNIRPSYLDTRLATGPKYEPKDVSLLSSPIEFRTSGVCVIGMNEGIKYIKSLKKSSPLKVLHVKGMLGEATRFLYKDEKVMARAKYSGLKKTTMETVLSSFQAAHQKKIFAEFGVSIQSQAAYELAAEGMLRPLKGDIPVIYSVKCIEFNPPEFTLEIICIKETENYLLKFVHDLGLQLRTLAHCTGMRCIKYGPFTVHNALLTKECTLENVRKNMKLCKKLLMENRANKSIHLNPVPGNNSTSQNSFDLPKIN